jgi:hypothetical protein
MANLSKREICCQQGEMTGIAIWGGNARERLPPWSVFWRIAPGN